MKKVNLNGNIIELFDNINELPINRFMIYNRNLMIDAGVGSDANSYLEHTQMIRKFLQFGETEKAQKELTNLETNVFFAINKSSPVFRSFFALIYSVNGRIVEDHEVENPDELQDELNKKGLTFGKLKGWLNELKKNFEIQFENFLDSIAGTSSVKRKTLLIKDRTLLKLEEIIKGVNKEKEIFEKEKMIFDYYIPQTFGGKKGVEVLSILDFQDTCNTLERLNFSNPKQMSVIAFFRALIQLKKEHGKNKGK